MIHLLSNSRPFDREVDPRLLQQLVSCCFVTSNGLMDQGSVFHDELKEFVEFGGRGNDLRKRQRELTVILVGRLGEEHLHPIKVSLGEKRVIAVGSYGFCSSVCHGLDQFHDDKAIALVDFRVTLGISIVCGEELQDQRREITEEEKASDTEPLKARKLLGHEAADDCTEPSQLVRKVHLLKDDKEIGSCGRELTGREMLLAERSQGEFQQTVLQQHRGHDLGDVFSEEAGVHIVRSEEELGLVHMRQALIQQQAQEIFGEMKKSS